MKFRFFLHGMMGLFVMCQTHFSWAESSKPGSVVCTKASLEEQRRGKFKSLFLESQYGEAARVLMNYIESAGCFKALAFGAKKTAQPSTAEIDLDSGNPNNDVESSAVDTYLWGMSDVILAEMKAGHYSKCIQLAQAQLNESPINYIDVSGNKVIKRAIETNLNICTKRNK